LIDFIVGNAIIRDQAFGVPSNKLYSQSLRCLAIRTGVACGGFTSLQSAVKISQGEWTATCLPAL